MAEIIRAITELLRTVGEMAGGRIRGQIAFWIVFVAIVTLSAKPSYESVDYVLKQLGVGVGLPYIFVSLLVSLISVIMLVGLAGVLGTLLGLFVRFAFATPTRIRIDDLFAKLMPIVRSADTLGVDVQTTKQLQADAEKLYAQWNSSRINKFLKWQVKKKQSKKGKKNVNL